jgi:hypothetical protein
LHTALLAALRELMETIDKTFGIDKLPPQRRLSRDL